MHIRNPIWLYCPRRFRILWANQEALVLWNAASLFELRSRDLTQGTSEPRMLAHHSHSQRIEQGEIIEEIASLRPRGVVRIIKLRHHHARLPDDTSAWLTEGELEPPAEQLVELASNLSTLLLVYKDSGAFGSANMTVFSAFGENIPSLEALLNNRTPLPRSFPRSRMWTRWPLIASWKPCVGCGFFASSFAGRTPGMGSLGCWRP